MTGVKVIGVIRDMTEMAKHLKANGNSLRDLLQLAYKRGVAYVKLVRVFVKMSRVACVLWACREVG